MHYTFASKRYIKTLASELFSSFDIKHSYKLELFALLHGFKSFNGMIHQSPVIPLRQNTNTLIEDISNWCIKHRKRDIFNYISENVLTADGWPKISPLEPCPVKFLSSTGSYEIHIRLNENLGLFPYPNLFEKYKKRTPNPLVRNRILSDYLMMLDEELSYLASQGIPMRPSGIYDLGDFASLRVRRNETHLIIADGHEYKSLCSNTISGFLDKHWSALARKKANNGYENISFLRQELYRLLLDHVESMKPFSKRFQVEVVLIKRLHNAPTKSYHPEPFVFEVAKENLSSEEITTQIYSWIEASCIDDTEFTEFLGRYIPSRALKIKKAVTSGNAADIYSAQLPHLTVDPKMIQEWLNKLATPSDHKPAEYPRMSLTNYHESCWVKFQSTRVEPRKYTSYLDRQTLVFAFNQQDGCLSIVDLFEDQDVWQDEGLFTHIGMMPTVRFNTLPRSLKNQLYLRFQKEIYDDFGLCSQALDLATEQLVYSWENITTADMPLSEWPIERRDEDVEYAEAFPVILMISEAKHLFEMSGIELHMTVA